ncbi:MAG TPA: hypothetical protein VFH06_03575 [Candidatus Saccharimonadales bacterium]|nr:hypothetical protein [Candidatus Saccharimonadales bacterium]
MSIPEPSTILEVLRRDRVYGKPELFDQVKDFAAKLPEILRPYLGDEVTPPRYFEVMLVTRQQLIEETTLDHLVLQETIQILREWQEHPQRAYRFANTTEADYILSGHVGLSEPLKQRYRNGELLFIDILREQPSFFLL